MKDTKKILRMAIFNALDGNITYDSNDVPIVDEKMKAGVTNNQFILLSNQYETPESENDTCFITRSSIDIEIVDKSGNEVSKDAVDDIYEDILDIIFPSTTTIGLTIPNGFQFQNGYRESCTTQSVAISTTETIIVSRFKLTFTIIEK